jgi:hypothetical protein
VPDFGNPVAQNVNVDPNKGLTTLSNLMSLQQQKQAIQSKDIAIQQQKTSLAGSQAEVQGQQQAMQERQLLQKSMLSGKDPDGNSLMGPDGEADPVAVTRFANKHLPLIGQAVVQHIVKTQQDRLGLADTNRQLGQNSRNDIAGIIRSSMGDENTPPASGQDISAKIDAYVQQQGPNAPPALTKSAAYAKSLLQNLNGPVPPDKAKLALLHLAQGYEPAASVTAQQQPHIGTVTDAQGNVQTTQQNPLSPVSMGKVGPSVEQGIAPGIFVDPQGQPHYIGGKTVQGSGSLPTKTGVEAASSATAGMSSHFENLNIAAQNLPLATGLTKTIEGLAPSAFVGVGGDKKQYIAGLLQALPGHFTPTGDAQTDTNLLHKAMAQLNMSTPAGTDAARTLVEAGQPNTKMDPAAIKEAAGTVLGQVRMNVAERNFLQTARYSNKGQGDIETYQQGRQKFEASADPRIWQYEDLAKNNPKAARSFLQRQPDKADLVRKTKELESMGFFR